MSRLFSRTTARIMNGIGGFGVERNDESSPAIRGRKNAVIPRFPPRKSVVFLDETDLREQQQARFDSIEVRPAAASIPENTFVPIGFYQDADIADVSAGGIVHVTMRRSRLPEDALPGAKHWYDPFVPLMEFPLGTTLNHSYQGQDFNLRWDVSDSGISGHYGRFLLPVR